MFTLLLFASWQKGAHSPLHSGFVLAFYESTFPGQQFLVYESGAADFGTQVPVFLAPVLLATYFLPLFVWPHF